MPGRGPAPKDPSKRARRNADPVAIRVLPALLVSQPELPSFSVEEDGQLVDFVWPSVTRDWWQMWADSPLSAGFTSTDWSFLRDTALIHARHWRGEKTAAGELRLREAKFGATPEDRARLRIQFAQADEAESKTSVRASSRDRFSNMQIESELG